MLDSEAKRLIAELNELVHTITVYEGVHYTLLIVGLLVFARIIALEGDKIKVPKWQNVLQYLVAYISIGYSVLHIYYISPYHSSVYEENQSELIDYLTNDMSIDTTAYATMEEYEKALDKAFVAENMQVPKYKLDALYRTKWKGDTQ